MGILVARNFARTCVYTVHVSDNMHRLHMHSSITYGYPERDEDMYMHVEPA